MTPDDAALPTHPFEALLGGEPQENGTALQALLDGEGGAYRDAVLLNSAARPSPGGTRHDAARRRGERRAVHR